MYKRRTWTGCKKYRENQRRAKDHKRLESDDLDYEPEFVPPRLRRIVIVIDFDFGKMVKFFKFYRTGRIDTYMIKDEEGNQVKAGWNNFLRILSKCYPSIRRTY